MKKFFIAAILLLTGFGFSQETPNSLARAVFERVYATQMESCYDASVVLNEDLSNFDFVYCGVIGDTVTSVNQRWTAGVYRSYGYEQYGRWEFTTFGPNYYPIEGYMGLFSNNQYASVVALGIIRQGYREVTVIVLTFNKLQSGNYNQGNGYPTGYPALL
jgi:hypothetical protein